jgi:predicted DNA-binding transcriptional regulator YafY
MHANAKLTPRGRSEMITDLQRHGLTLREAAASRSVSEKTVRRWFARVQQEGISEGIFEHSCVPRRHLRNSSENLRFMTVSSARWAAVSDCSAWSLPENGSMRRRES